MYGQRKRKIGGINMYDAKIINSLNQDIKDYFPKVFTIDETMSNAREGVSRLVMLDRYAQKDVRKETLKVGDVVIAEIIPHPDYPTQGIGRVKGIDGENVSVELEEEFAASMSEEETEKGYIVRNIDLIEKPVELYYEQIAKRVSRGLGQNVKEEKQFFDELSNQRIVPAGRVLYGAGSGTEVTYFNCYVMPFMKDSRGGISEHRKEVMEIMSRGGGVGTNGSTLRPRNALARGVNGISSGSVSWLNDLASLTHLVEQGGSRRGAQMIMLADSHPDIIEFIISKMQNPNILRRIIQTTNDDEIRETAQAKLKFEPLNEIEQEIYESTVGITEGEEPESETRQYAKQLVEDGGRYSVNDPDFLTGANISVTITDDFMRAVKNDEEFPLRFPDVENYTKEEMEYYNKHWHECGDVREWEKEHGMAVKTYRTIKAQELWDLINTCATYSAEPGIFFIDAANEKTNAQAYGQKVVATNPCGEQPLTPYSVCNLSAINLAEFADEEHKNVDYEKLVRTVERAVRMQDNVIDETPYFLEDNKEQAIGERRIGLGVMGLHDLLIKCETKYGSKEGNDMIDHLFRTMATTAYRTSIELAKEKGSFPFLIGETEEETKKLRGNFINTGYMKNMPVEIREGILKHGIRNSHLLTIAPTGSTGTMMNVSTGLEPYFSFSYFRSGRLGQFIEVNADIVQEYLEKNPDADPNNLPEWFVSAMELKPEEHVDVQCTIQHWVDSSISKTVNAPRGYQVEDVAKIYQRLYDQGAKGGTVYVDGSRDSQVLTLKEDLEEEEIVEDTKVEKSETKVVEFTERQGKSKEEVLVTTGTEVGDTCPTCESGTIEFIGGCNTCTNCGQAQTCGL